MQERQMTRDDLIQALRREAVRLDWLQVAYGAVEPRTTAFVAAAELLMKKADTLALRRFARSRTGRNGVHVYADQN